MSRQHSSQFQKPADPYAGHRCECRHLVYQFHTPGDPCLFAAEGCPCTEHRVKEVATDGSAAE